MILNDKVRRELPMNSSKIRIVDIDKPSDYIDIESFGRGLDPGDKGFGKASTYARKYALLNAYKIATGEDPDKDKSKEMQPIKLDEAKNKIGKNPTALDTVEVPQIKKQQDIEVKIAEKNNSPQKQR